mgnify:CR=1 FL=1
MRCDAPEAQGPGTAGDLPAARERERTLRPVALVLGGLLRRERLQGEGVDRAARFHQGLQERVH